MRVLTFSLILTPGSAPIAIHTQTRDSPDETIVLIRHAEKPDPPFGQLSCKGLNRALALPSVLAPYGRPTVIFVPNPADRIKDGNDSADAPTYSYVRPLATIEPYAIGPHMPVDTQIGYDQISQLETEVLQPQYAHVYVLIVWEHLQAVHFARQLLAKYGEDPTSIPHWLNSDYDTIYVFHLTSDASGKMHLSVRTDNEDLAGRLPGTCPSIQLPPPPAKTSSSEQR